MLLDTAIYIISSPSVRSACKIGIFNFYALSANKRHYVSWFVCPLSTNTYFLYHSLYLVVEYH